MRRIWKIDVPVDDQAHSFSLPHGTQIRHVACQHLDAVGLVQIWFEVYDDAPHNERRFIVHGTGQPIPEGIYVGTGIELSGRLVWHVYELI